MASALHTSQSRQRGSPGSSAPPRAVLLSRSTVRPREPLLSRDRICAIARSDWNGADHILRAGFRGILPAPFGGRAAVRRVPE